jgi:hypothetical protein
MKKRRKIGVEDVRSKGSGCHQEAAGKEAADVRSGDPRGPSRPERAGVERVGSGHARMGSSWIEYEARPHLNSAWPRRRSTCEAWCAQSVRRRPTLVQNGSQPELSTSIKSLIFAHCLRSRSVFLTTYCAKASFATMGVTDSLKKLYESEMTGANRESTMVSCPLPSNAAVDRDGRFARSAPHFRPVSRAWTPSS